MGERSLNITEIGTFKRKIQNSTIIIPDGFSSYHVDENRARSDCNLGHLPGRMISSGTVVRVRSTPQAKASVDSEDESRRVPNPKNEECDTSLLKLPRSYNNWTGGLRTPIRNVKQKSAVSEVDTNTSGMTKNCEQLFSQMMSTYGPVKTELGIDPSFSVRRIVKGSGLLKSFGTGYLEKEEALSNESERCYSGGEENQSISNASDHLSISQQQPLLELSSEISDDAGVFEAAAKTNVGTAFNLDEFMKAPTFPTDGQHQFLSLTKPMSSPQFYRFGRSENDQPDGEDSDEPPNISSDGNSLPSTRSYRQTTPHRTSPSSPVVCDPITSSPLLYDTVVLQKTVETEVVQYLPTTNGSPATRTSPMTSDQSRTISRRSSQVRRPRRKRGKYFSTKATPTCPRRDDQSGYEPSSEDEVTSSSSSSTA